MVARSCALLLGCLCCAWALRTGTEDGDLIGWQGDSFDPRAVFGGDSDTNRHASQGPVQISEKPHAFVWRNFITAAEARHVVELAAPRMMRSMVGGGRAIDSVRTSYGMFIPRYQDAVIATIQKRISRWLGVPVSFQEDMQVLRYEEGQRYKPHMDANNRMCTILVYLTNTTEGGETAFPNTSDKDWLDPTLAPDSASLSPDCARGHVAVKPEVGTALLFYSMPPGAEKEGASRVVDPLSMHTGCPPTRGARKWTATVWVHPEPFRPESYTETFKPPMPDPATCGNFHAQCEHWASVGECDKNPNYMVGGPGTSGQCRKACRTCTPCAAEDRDCLAASRGSQGFLPDLQAEFEQLFGTIR